MRPQPQRKRTTISIASKVNVYVITTFLSTEGQYVYKSQEAKEQRYPIGEDTVETKEGRK